MMPPDTKIGPPMRLYTDKTNWVPEGKEHVWNLMLVEAVNVVLEDLNFMTVANVGGEFLQILYNSRHTFYLPEIVSSLSAYMRRHCDALLEHARYDSIGRELRRLNSLISKVLEDIFPDEQPPDAVRALRLVIDQIVKQHSAKVVDHGN